MTINKSNREKSIEAVDILNDFIGDCVSSVNVLRGYLKDLKDDDSRPSMLFVAVHRLCMSYLLLTMAKWLEFYDRYHCIIPPNIRTECKNLTKELCTRKIKDFRNTCIGHIWNKKTNRPLYNSEIDDSLREITKGDLDGFLMWVNDQSNNVFPKTIVSIVETVRDMLMEEHGINYDDEILNR